MSKIRVKGKEIITKKMNKDILKQFGFFKEVERIDNNLCPLCSSDKVNPEDFDDDLSRKEFNISGMCQSCQNKIFDIETR